MSVYGSWVAQLVKNLLQCSRPWFDSWMRSCPGEGTGYPLQYSCLENLYGQRILVLTKWLSTHRLWIYIWILWKWKWLSVSDSLRPHGLYSPWNSPGQNTGEGSLSLLHGVFPTQGSNPGLPHCKGILYQLTHKGSSRIWEWVAYPFSRGSSQTRNWTGDSCIAGMFFTNWAVREVLL